MIKYAQVQALRKRAFTEIPVADRLRLAEDRGYRRGSIDTEGSMLKSMMLGAPIGSAAGTLASSFLIQEKMSAARKLAILLSGAGIGAAAGAGIAGATHLGQSMIA